MSGVRDLKKMEASDMLDVIHCIFEEDTIPLYDEHQDVKSRFRESLYNDLYDRPYNYGTKRKKSSQQDALGFDPSMELPEKVDGVKPYIPATNPEDFPSILDAPLG